MAEVNWEEESKRFNATADYYDIYRPSYPAALIDCLEENTKLGMESAILEIGAGSGKASELFFDRGYELVCIEPGPQLAEMGRIKHKDKKATFIISRFEQWDEPRHTFDLVFSAQAFHWVPQPIGYEKCANTLRPEGYLALFWNMYLSDAELKNNELILLCTQYGVFPFQDAKQIEARKNIIAEEMVGSGYFKSPSIHSYPWNQQYNTDQFIGFLRTGNGFLALPERDQEDLIHKVIRILSISGGLVTLEFISVLFISQKKAI